MEDRIQGVILKKEHSIQVVRHLFRHSSDDFSNTLRIYGTLTAWDLYIVYHNKPCPQAAPHGDR